MGQTLQSSNDFSMPYRYRKNYSRSYGAQSEYATSTATAQRSYGYGSGNGYYMHTSSALAPDYEDDYEESIQPQQKERKKAQQKHLYLVQYIPVILITFVLGMALVLQSAYIANLGYQVSHSKTELKNTLSENEKLKRSIASMGELNGVEAVAMYQMGMHRPGANEIIYLAAIPADGE